MIVSFLEYSEVLWLYIISELRLRFSLKRTRLFSGLYLVVMATDLPLEVVHSTK